MRNRLLISIILLLCISGCARRQAPLTFAVGGAPSEIDYWVKLVGEFEQRHKTHVKIIRQPTDSDQRRQSLVVALESKKSDPDVFLMDVVWVSQFAASGWLELLDDYMEKGGVDPAVFFDKVLNLADKYNKNIIALPVYVDGGLLYYRKDLLQKYGYKRPPETWQELVDYSLKAQEGERETNPNFYGFLWQGAQYEGLICNFLEFAASCGGGIKFFAGDRAASGKKPAGIVLNTPQNQRAVQFMYELIHKYRVSPPNTFTEMKEEEVRLSFQNGNALFERNWPYAWALHQSEDSAIRDKVGIASLPHCPRGESKATLGGWHIGISKYSDRKQESFLFLKFVVSYDTQKKLVLELGWNPGREDVYTDDEVTERLPHFRALRGVFENAYPRPTIPYYTLVSEVIQRYINAALSGRITPQVALASAEREAQQFVERYR